MDTETGLVCPAIIVLGGVKAKVLTAPYYYSYAISCTITTANH